MRYLESQSQVAFRHLRNKNLDFLPADETLLLRIWTRLQRIATRRQRRALMACRPQLVVSEQIIENPMLLRHLPADAESILDFGGVESALPLILSALGHQVTVWDQREYPFRHPNLRVIQRDLFAEPPDPALRFDAVVSVSTIEHLGLGAYDDIVVPDADERGVALLWEMVRPGGRMIVTVPAGSPVTQGGYRVYDLPRLQKLIPHASVIHWFMKRGREGVWGEVEPDAVEDCVYEAPTAPLPVEAVAVAVSDKV
jgi:SAM-dependent methyltransferase